MSDGGSGLPDDAAAVVWVGPDGRSDLNGWILNGWRRFASESYAYPSNDTDPDAFPPISADQERVLYEPGDEIPLVVADVYYQDWTRYMAVFDADGNRLDEPRLRENKDAIERWRSSS
jgi:hypothetical protein